MAGVSSAILGVAKQAPALLRLVNGWPWLRNFLSGLIIRRTAGACLPRPHPYSLWTATEDPMATPDWAKRSGFDPDRAAAATRGTTFTSWHALTDRSFSARHLPPYTPSKKLPPLDEVVELFRRPKGQMRPSENNTVLLAFFVQWFTDSFLRTHPEDLRRNTSNHEIDFCQIYGLDEQRERALRVGVGGLLRSRLTETGEYPELLLRNGAVDPRFAFFEMAQPIGPDGRIAVDGYMQAVGMTAEEIAARRGRVYATGLERGSSNIGYAAISTLFLREHNRLARKIADRNKGWSDDRIFAAARNSVIVMGLKLVVEEYIVQLSRSPLKLTLDPPLAPRQRWYRTNHIAVEFNLLYRWHSMMPDHYRVGGQTFVFHDLQFHNQLLEETGLEALVGALSGQAAGYIGPRNVPDFLMPAEAAAHRMSRGFALAPMNAYRKRFGLDRLRSFEELTEDVALRDAVAALYGNDIDAVEFLPGMFSEGDRNDASFGSLLMRMVGYDAFTQALTNPLLAPQIFVPETFSQVGWEAIHETGSLDDIFQRNTEAGGRHTASLDLGPRDRGPSLQPAPGLATAGARGW